MKLSAIASLAALVASCSAFPWSWATSALNAKQRCLVPVGTVPNGQLMDVQSVLDGKNGVHCNIAFNASTNTITVKSDTASRVGYIVIVTEGTVANLPGTPPQGANKQCAKGMSGKSAEFKWTPPAKPSGKPIKAGATCGENGKPTMYTTANIVIQE